METLEEIAREKNVVRSIFASAVKRGYLKENPFKGNRQALYVTEPEKDFYLVSRDELQKLLEVSNEKWQAVLTIAWLGGLRREDILGLDWSDVDLDNSLLHVRNNDTRLTKTRKIHKVPMAPQVKEALSRLRFGMLKDKLVFPRTLNNVDRAYRLLVNKAGLVDDQGDPLFHLHDMRKTCCTEMQRKGVPIKTAQKILGHANLSTTAKYYTGVEEKDLRNAIAKLSETA